MRILFVTPYPLSRIKVRSYGFVNHLVKQHEVVVLALCATEKEIADVRALKHEGIDITAIEEKRRFQLLRSLGAVGTQLPLQVAFCAAPHLRAAISARVESGRFDLIHVEALRTLGALPNSLPIPVVLDMVDCISRLYEQGSRFGATPIMRFIGKNEARRIRAFERQQLQRFHHILVSSERDRQALLELTGGSSDDTTERTLAKITALPHGVDQHYFHPHTGHRQPGTLIFSGTMSYHANVAGVHTLVEDILPHIWERRPHIRLVIAGSNPPASVRRLARDPRIEVTGYVPDLRPYIVQAQVAVSPLPYAAGIQNKVLEAMALGTPVVASSSVSAGLQALAGHDLLVADTPEEFAAAVLRLLDDQVLWNKLAERGLAYIAMHHDWEHIMRRLTAVYTNAVGMANLIAPASTGNERKAFSMAKGAFHSKQSATKP